MATRPTTQPCDDKFAPRVCLTPELIPGQLRMPHSPSTNRRPALALRSSTPATASMSSTATSCCETWPTIGIGEADLHSTGTGTGHWVHASSGLIRANQPS